MMGSFKCKKTKILFEDHIADKQFYEISRQALAKLMIIHSADRLEDLTIPPANRLEKLHGDRSGQYSIRINNKWRICFTWSLGHAYEIETVDYHK